MRNSAGKLDDLIHFSNAAYAFAPAFPVFLTDQVDKFVKMFVNQGFHPEQDLSALGNGGVGPSREGLGGSQNSRINFFLGTLGCQGGYFTGGRVEALHIFFGFGLQPLAVYIVF